MAKNIETRRSGMMMSFIKQKKYECIKTELIKNKKELNLKLIDMVKKEVAVCLFVPLPH